MRALAVAEGHGKSRGRRFLCLLFTVLLLFPNIAYGLGPAVLGDPPGENAAEQVCVSLIAVENATGGVLKRKNADTAITLVGGMVRLMAALTALDYLRPDDAITPVTVDFGLPGDARLIGFRTGQTVSVEEVLAAMLVYCANDAGEVLADAVEKAASADDFVALMNQKAFELGMLHTNYVNPTGISSTSQISTAEDQMILARAAFENDVIAAIMGRYEYMTTSPDAGLPAVMRQYSAIMLPDDASYDSRVTAVARGSGEGDTNILIRAQSGGSDVIVIMVYPSRSVSTVYEAAVGLIDAYTGMLRLDLSRAVEEKAALLTDAADKAVLPWKLKAGQNLTVSVYGGFTLDAAGLAVTPRADSFAQAEDGTATLVADISYGGNALGTVELTAPLDMAALATPTPSPEPVATETPLPMYQPDDVEIRYSFMEQYGWLVFIAAAAALAGLVIVAGRLLREKL